MKTYIFFTVDIKSLGGMQMYVSSKAEYLSKNGWDVLVLYSSYRSGDCVFPGLNRYKEGLVQGLNIPPFKWSNIVYNRIINKCLETIGRREGEIIIESHNDAYSLWAEIIAAKLGAKHIVVLLNELYRGKNKYYEEKIDFYRYKLNRGEIGGVEGTIKKLFDGYLEFDNTSQYDFIINENPIQDIPNKEIDNLQLLDWNICVISRPDKGYIPVTIDEVVVFANNHKKKRIGLSLIGSKKGYQKIIKKRKSIPDNLEITLLGNIIPLCKTIFTKFDVFIAGGGTARAAAYEGALVIVPDSNNYKSNGLLGYEVFDACFNQDEKMQKSISDSLTQVLVENIQNSLVFDYPCNSVESCVLQNFDFISRSSATKEYYSEALLCDGEKKMSARKKMMYFFASHCPRLFGAIFTLIYPR